MKTMDMIKGLLSILFICLMVTCTQAASADVDAAEKVFYEGLYQQNLGMLMENDDVLLASVNSENMLDHIAALSFHGDYKWSYQLEPSLFIQASAMTTDNMGGYIILGRENKEAAYKVILLDGNGTPVSTAFLENKAFAAVAIDAGCYYVMPNENGSFNQLFFKGYTEISQKLIHSFDFTISGVYLLHHSEQLDVLKLHYYRGTDSHQENMQSLLLGIDSTGDVRFQCDLGKDVWGSNYVSEDALCPNKEGGITFVRNKDELNTLLITAINMQGEVIWENEVSGSFYSLFTMLLTQDAAGYYELWGQTGASEKQKSEDYGLFHLRLHSDGSYVSDEVKSHFNPQAVYCDADGNVYIASFSETEGGLVRLLFQDVNMDTLNALSVSKSSNN